VAKNAEEQSAARLVSTRRLEKAFKYRPCDPKYHLNHHDAEHNADYQLYSRAAEYAALFPSAELVVQPGAGHYPWLDDPQAFVRAVEGPPPPHPSHARGGAREGAGDTGGR